MRYRFDQILCQQEKSLWTQGALFPLYLASLPYGWLVRFRTRLYQIGLCRTHRLPCPVISVGNITVGGTGKTPLVIALAKRLTVHGIQVAILARGYGGRSSKPLVTDGKEVFLSPSESGDEPYLMATSLKGVPILIGKDRFRNGQYALQRLGVRGFLLDDGFQHLGLHRDINILLIDVTQGFGNGHLLPRGILREPLNHLRRADLFLLTKVESPEACQPLEALLRKVHPNPVVFHSHYEPVGLFDVRRQCVQTVKLKGRRVLALSGIANPHSFFSVLKRTEAEVVAEEVYPDHHRYTAKDIARLARRAARTDFIVTTEKDMVKLENFDLSHLPIYALRIELRIWEEEQFFTKIMSLFVPKEELH